MRKVAPVLVFLLLASAQAFARGPRVGCGDSEMCGLVIRGDVTGLEVEKDADHVRFHVKLNVEFTNEGGEPIILFAPTFGKTHGPESCGYWLGGWSLYGNDWEAKGGKAIFVEGRWESIDGSDSYRELAEQLDAKTPPDEHTIILQPGQSWKSSDAFTISFVAEDKTAYLDHRTWAEMQEFPPQLWLRISYELSPWNVEYFKPNLIRKLKKRWASFGNILVAKETDGRYNHFRVMSEPMRIDFSQAKTKGTGAEVGTGMR